MLAKGAREIISEKLFSNVRSTKCSLLVLKKSLRKTNALPDFLKYRMIA
jgi:hypothetical protein